MAVMAAAATAPAAALLPAPGMPVQLQPPILVTDAFAKDSIIAWYRGEFAAANAIIDALCGHLAEIGAGRLELYEAMFTAVHRRRMNWIPVLQMQKYHSIAEVALELKRAAAAIRSSAEIDERRSAATEREETVANFDTEKDGKCSEVMGNGSVSGEIDPDEDSPASDITDSGSQVMQLATTSEESQVLCSNHDDCLGRAAQIKLIKGFKAKETVKGRKVNVAKGLKLYEDVFTESESCKLVHFVNELRLAGQSGELSGESFILFNKEIKGSKRELIQFGLPIFEPIQEEAASDNELCGIEPIPELLQGVIDHFVQWELIPAHKKPNSCIINFFDEGEFAQPFLKPPHLDHPISTLLLNESTMAFGRYLVSNGDGNYKAPLMLSLKQGSLLVMRGNSVDVARHAMCPSSTRRVTISFFRVRSDSGTCHANPAPLVSSPYTLPLVPNWGIPSSPLAVFAAPVQLAVASPEDEKVLSGGTGVFLPWMVGSRRRGRRLPPRAQKG